MADERQNPDVYLVEDDANILLDEDMPQSLIDAAEQLAHEIAESYILEPEGATFHLTITPNKKGKVEEIGLYLPEEEDED